MRTKGKKSLCAEMGRSVMRETSKQRERGQVSKNS